MKAAGPEGPTAIRSSWRHQSLPVFKAPRRCGRPESIISFRAGFPDELPEDSRDALPEDFPDGLPEDSPDVLPEDFPDASPEDSPDALPEDSPDASPEDFQVLFVRKQGQRSSERAAQAPQQHKSFSTSLFSPIRQSGLQQNARRRVTAIRAFELWISEQLSTPAMRLCKITETRLRKVDAPIWRTQEYLCRPRNVVTIPS